MRSRVALDHAHARSSQLCTPVGVVDVLPLSFCSNYFLYNPSYRWLNPGKVSALYEMQWLRLVRPHGGQGAGRCPWVADVA